MNIDFPPPSSGTYNNAGSSRRLADYLEHEDLERMEKGIYTEGFFNLTAEDLYKSQVVKDIDNNKAQLLKTDAKFYAIHVSPSAKELQVMGSTEQEQAEAMRRYVREVFIPEYAKNFNKGLSAENIKFYGKVHFDRDRSENKEGNMHCHLIVSRKDQSNKIKLSPLTNHKNTKKGVITGGFDRKNLFQQAEQGFDRLFNYDRQLTESFEYYNTMKNGSISEQLNMQEKRISYERRMNTDTQVGTNTDVQIGISADKQENKQEQTHFPSQTDLGISSVLGIFTPDISKEEEPQLSMKKKQPKRGQRR
ncbi:DUF5712 family protein [Dysgonomonas sp. BGC7]|uniref:DUF5712 family protein n=1 Tax=Dysgonomonas sp. BGC7 TaxID=1658008 RepID=UPI000680C57C|nr:DUF5712 family protein [Dysgonomonas sp. BGC7]MBD8387430.1 clindamycin resistance transfer factor BtgB [Dysgonomonas sp. BGC7]